MNGHVHTGDCVHEHVHHVNGNGHVHHESGSGHTHHGNASGHTHHENGSGHAHHGNAGGRVNGHDQSGHVNGSGGHVRDGSVQSESGHENVHDGSGRDSVNALGLWNGKMKKKEALEKTRQSKLVSIPP